MRYTARGVADISVCGASPWGWHRLHKYVCTVKLYVAMHDRYQYACKHSGPRVGPELLRLGIRISMVFGVGILLSSSFRIDIVDRYVGLQQIHSSRLSKLGSDLYVVQYKEEG